MDMCRAQKSVICTLTLSLLILSQHSFCLGNEYDFCGGANARDCWSISRGTNATYSSGSSYANSVQTVLNALLNSQIPQGKTFITNTSADERAYGLLSCRADASQQECNNCSATVREYMERTSPNLVGSSGWRNLCFLRYDNFSFFDVLDSSPLQMLSSQPLSDFDSFNRTVSQLMRNLSVEATVSTNSSVGYIGYAYGSAHDSLNNLDIYGFVQCWGYIDAESCRNCTTQISSPNSTATSVASLTNSCYTRFDTQQFYDFSSVNEASSRWTQAVLVAGLSLLLHLGFF